ncbi:MAG: hypothetical protein AB8G05_26720 [Oligoflexales bacterium]
MKPSTHLLTATIFWYLSIGSPSVCLGSSIQSAKSWSMASSADSRFSMLQLSKEIKAENLSNISEILNISRHLINQLDETGKSPLMLAISLRKTKVVRHLLRDFSDHINFGLTDRKNHATALDYANFVETKHIYNLLIPYY